MKRFHLIVLGAIGVLFVLASVHPTAALAQLNFNDSMFTSGLSTGGWMSTLQDNARTVYVGLFSIELVVVGIQGALYKDNIAEFMQTFAFKTLVACLFLAIIGNANTIFPGIVNTFCNVAINVSGAGAGTGGCSSGAGAGNPAGLETNMLLWAVQYFAAADISRAADSAEAAAAGIVVFGTGVPGLSTAFLMGHENFALFCIALGMTCVMSAAGIFLTYLLLTFETQIVIAIGVIFLAFQGSRFTAQFSSGYMSYAVNVGTKFFVFYFMVAVLQNVVSQGNSSLGASIASLIAGAAIPFGAGSIAIVALSSPIPVICVVTSILVAAIPNFAGSLLQGTSALSASAGLQNSAVQSAMGAGAGAFSMGSQLAGAAGKSGGSASAGHGGGSGGGSPSMGTGAGASEQMGSSSSNNVSMAPSGDAAPSGGSAGGESGGGEGGGSFDTGNEGGWQAATSVGNLAGARLGGNGSSGSGGSGSAGAASMSDSGGDMSTNGGGGGGGGGGGDDGSYDSADSMSDDGANYGDGAGDGSDTSAPWDQYGDEEDPDTAMADSSDSSDSSNSSDGTGSGSGSGSGSSTDGSSSSSTAPSDAAASEGRVRPLETYSAEQISNMSPDELRAAAAKSNYQSLSEAQREVIMSNPDLRNAAVSGYKQNFGNNFASNLSQAGQKTDYAGMAAKAVPAGEQPPSAVQIRVTNPDKL